MIYISGITSDKIEDVWPICKEYIDLGNSKSRDEMDVEDIYDRLLHTQMQLWLVFDENSEVISCLTTEVILYPQKKTCRIVTLGGKDLDLWVDKFLDTLEEWAIQAGCEAIETSCRKGFIKKLEKFGYEHTYTVLGKELTTKH